MVTVTVAQTSKYDTTQFEIQPKKTNKIFNSSKIFYPNNEKVLESMSENSQNELIYNVIERTRSMVYTLCMYMYT